MIAKWKFIAVTTPPGGSPMTMALNVPPRGRIFRGTASEALFLAHKIRPPICSYLIVATCGDPPEIPNDLEWAVSILTRRTGRQGWDLIVDEVVHHIPMAGVRDATHYALFCATGKLAAVRVVSGKGALRQLVLCDMRPADPGLGLETAESA